MPLLHPTSDLVAVAWLKALAGLTDGQVSTTLPQDTTTWATAGFVTAATVGGTPDMYVPMARPAVSLDCWAVSPNSGSPPWGKANQLAEIVRAAVYNLAEVTPLLVSLPATYNDARVLSAYLLSEPRRVHDDDASYARYTCDLQLHWVEVPG